MVKMSKKKNDVSFYDPVTMEVRCTFNQCVKKFTVEGSEIVTKDNGGEFIVFYHQCEECGQRVRAKGDSEKGYIAQMSRLATGEYKYNPNNK